MTSYPLASRTGEDPAGCGCQSDPRGGLDLALVTFDSTVRNFVLAYSAL